MKVPFTNEKERFRRLTPLSLDFGVPAIPSALSVAAPAASAHAAVEEHGAAASSSVLGHTPIVEHAHGLWRGAAECVTIEVCIPLSGDPRTEDSMAKGQMRSSKEAKKPKSDKPKSSMSEYKKSQQAGSHNVPPAGKKS